MLRSRGKRVAGLVLVGLLVAAGLVVRTGMANERQEFVSKIYARSGYRCRFTLSARWKRRQSNRSRTTASGGQVEIFVFEPSPLRQWSDNHLLHRHTSQPMVDLQCGTFKDTGNSWHLVDGYPEPTIQRGALPNQFRPYVHRHLLIDGCPSTVLTMGYGSIRITELLVSVPSQSLVYQIGGAQDTDEGYQVREMQSIIDSFHVEQVGARSSKP